MKGAAQQPAILVIQTLVHMPEQPGAVQENWKGDTIKRSK